MSALQQIAAALFESTVALWHISRVTMSSAEEFEGESGTDSGWSDEELMNSGDSESMDDGSSSEATPPPTPKKKAKTTAKKPAAKPVTTTAKRGSSEGAKPAPKKKAKVSKPPPLNDKAAKILISEYMTKQNRPYSHQNVFDNLHGQVKKSSVPKILEELAAEGSLTKKEYGKAKIFITDQSVFPEPNPETNAAIDEEIRLMKQKFEELTAEAATMRGKVKELASQPNDTDLDKILAEKSLVITEKEKKLAILKDSCESVSEADLVLKKKKLKENIKYWSTRKKAVKVMIDMISEGSGMRPAEIMEQHGLETDEDAGESLKDMKAFAQSIDC